MRFIRFFIIYFFLSFHLSNIYRFIFNVYIKELTFQLWCDTQWIKYISDKLLFTSTCMIQIRIDGNLNLLFHLNRIELLTQLSCHSCQWGSQAIKWIQHTYSSFVHTNIHTYGLYGPWLLTIWIKEQNGVCSFGGICSLDLQRDATTTTRSSKSHNSYVQQTLGIVRVRYI